jgi:hypothetical protein
MSEPDGQCPIWTTQPDVLAPQGVPGGYCGHCEACGRPGHTRHYRCLLWLHPMGRYGRRVCLVAIVGVLVAYTLWRT